MKDAARALIVFFLFAPWLRAQPCVAPGAPSIVFVPPGNVAVGRTYAIVWSEAANLDADGVYFVERSPSASFSPILDSQQTTSTSASFLPPSEGTIYHRVRAVPACDSTKASPFSAARNVNVVAGNPSVIFTVQPTAVITSLGDLLTNYKTTMTVENISRGPAQVSVLRQEINSPSFFSVIDPAGGDVASLTLEPRTPKTLEIRFAGPSKDLQASYQGVVFLVGAQPLTITPYAFVNLKVGGSSTATPLFVINGIPGEYAFFPGFPSGSDDASRPSISVEIQNPSFVPMELGAEIGPEVWLVPEPGWNATPIAPAASRTVRLFTNRTRAPTASALPRYTYFTVRSKSGQSARLLVQDNDTAPLSSGRSASLEGNARSYIIPRIQSVPASAQSLLRSSVRLSNVGTAAIPVELYFTPSQADGVDSSAVKRATVLVPPNDVVRLTDPLAQLRLLEPPATGQLEVRADPEKIGLLTVTSAVTTAAIGGGGFGYQIPVVLRGEGAKLGAPHGIFGVTANSDVRTILSLAETTGKDRSSVRVVLYDKDGNRLGDRVIEVPRYGYAEIDNVAPSLGGASLDGGRIELNVESGGGSTVGVVIVLDAATNSAAALVGQALGSVSVPPSFRRMQAVNWANSVSKVALVAPTVLNGPGAGPAGSSYQTLMGFSAPHSASASFTLTYRDDQRSAPLIRTLTVLARRSSEFRNILEELFGVTPGSRSQGVIMIEADSGAQVYATLYTRLSATSKVSVVERLPVIRTDSETVTGGGALVQRPLYYDGLEQSIDPSRGSRWNLLLSEVRGEPVTVTVRLYEAGNRALPIADKEFALGPLEQRKLETVFSAMGLDTDERRKDRTNVLCVVTGRSGTGLVTPTTISIDNRTGDVKVYSFTPNGGLPATGISKVTPGVTPSPPAPRRRSVRRGP